MIGSVFFPGESIGFDYVQSKLVCFLTDYNGECFFFTMYCAIF